MGRASIKASKSFYQLCREECGMTRAKASEAIGFLSESQIEKIENGKASIKADDIMGMAKAYKKPELFNYYCTHECSIGCVKETVTQEKPFESIVLDVLSGVNHIADNQKRLIDIASDGKINDDEIADFVAIKKDLLKISANVDSLMLWIDKEIMSGKINAEKLKEEESK